MSKAQDARLEQRRRLEARREENRELSIRERCRKFLRQLEECGDVKASAKLAGLTRSYLYRYRRIDSDFANEWDEAIGVSVSELEDEARRRALKASDPLLMFLLKAHKPAMYREKIDASIAGLNMIVVESYRIEDDRTKALPAPVDVLSAALEFEPEPALIVSAVEPRPAETIIDPEYAARDAERAP